MGNDKSRELPEATISAAFTLSMNELGMGCEAEMHQTNIATHSAGSKYTSPLSSLSFFDV